MTKCLKIDIGSLDDKAKCRVDEFCSLLGVWDLPDHVIITYRNYIVHEDDDGFDKFAWFKLYPISISYLSDSEDKLKNIFIQDPTILSDLIQARVYYFDDSYGTVGGDRLITSHYVRETDKWTIQDRLLSSPEYL